MGRQKAPRGLGVSIISQNQSLKERIFMKNSIKCAFGLHHYEVLKEEPLMLAGTNIEIGKVIVSRCADCGNIKSIQIRTNSWTF